MEDRNSAAQSPAGSDAELKSDAAGCSAAAGAAAPTVANAPGPTADEIRFAVTFTRIVSVLSRSPHYKHYTLSDLEWLVVPPILTGQCAVMEAKVNDRPVPLAVALWASVSEEVDKRLAENLATPIKLRPDEWRSGNILWLVDAVGESNATQRLLAQVQQQVLEARTVKIRTLGTDLRPIVTVLKPPSN